MKGFTNLDLLAILKYVNNNKEPTMININVMNLTDKKLVRDREAEKKLQEWGKTEEARKMDEKILKDLWFMV